MGWGNNIPPPPKHGHPCPPNNPHCQGLDPVGASIENWILAITIIILITIYIYYKMKKQHQMITDLKYYFDNTPREEVLRAWNKSKDNSPKCGPTINDFFKYNKPKTLFEKFYDSVSNFLSGGKSIAPNELKSF